jgi:hypothetical protein
MEITQIIQAMNEPGINFDVLSEQLHQTLTATSYNESYRLYISALQKFYLLIKDANISNAQLSQAWHFSVERRAIIQAIHSSYTDSIDEMHARLEFLNIKESCDVRNEYILNLHEYSKRQESMHRYSSGRTKKDIENLERLIEQYSPPLDWTPYTRVATKYALNKIFPDGVDAPPAKNATEVFGAAYVSLLQQIFLHHQIDPNDPKVIADTVLKETTEELFGKNLPLAEEINGILLKIIDAENIFAQHLETIAIKRNFNIKTISVKPPSDTEHPALKDDLSNGLKDPTSRKLRGSLCAHKKPFNQQIMTGFHTTHSKEMTR